MQNMMLATHALGIGSCWIGEILPFSEEVKQILHINDQNLELMAIIVFGYKAGKVNNPGRKNIESFLL